jgi:hypothetical protein
MIFIIIFDKDHESWKELTHVAMIHFLHFCIMRSRTPSYNCFFPK